MPDEFENKKIFALVMLLSLLITGGYFLYFKSLKQTFIVFCNVGQGDAAYIRIKGKIDVLVDAGPSRKILDCLGKNMPFWDKKIEIAILSHPQKDHFGGFLQVMKKYKIDYFFMPKIEGSANSFKTLEDYLTDKDIEIIFPTAGYKIETQGDTFIFLWPPKEIIKDLSFGKNNLNDYSLIFKFKEGKQSITFTGDAPSNVLNLLSNKAKGESGLNIKTNILKIPHHGSANSLSVKFIKLANPSIAVISSGKNNSYGHPSKKTLNLLQALNIKILRTDEKGDIKITFGKDRLLIH